MIVAVTIEVAGRYACDDCPFLRDDDRNGVWCSCPGAGMPPVVLGVQRRGVYVKRGRCPLRDGAITIRRVLR